MNALNRPWEDEVIASITLMETYDSYNVGNSPWKRIQFYCFTWLTETDTSNSFGDDTLYLFNRHYCVTILVGYNIEWEFRNKDIQSKHTGRAAVRHNKACQLDGKYQD